MTNKAFKVIIVGGGITGLGLVNMLESAGIDFVLLESHNTVVPGIGASVGFTGAALRILDQLGCYEAVLQKANRPARHGYPLFFISREDLLKILYANIKQNERILTRMKVEEVTMATGGGVRVRTTDGGTFAGDILVGADGIRSTVRQEMWRLASKSQPGYFPPDELSNVDCRYMAMFGITKPNSGPSPSFAYTTNHQRAYVSATGTDDTKFWFMLRAINWRDGTNIPRFTQDDAKRVVEEIGDDRVTQEWTFRQLYENSTTTGTTAVVEYVFKRWHFQRIITIGEAAHVHHPVTGLGVMSCLESSAELVNALNGELEGVPTTRLTDDTVDRMCAHVQDARMERVKFMYQRSWTMADAYSLKGPARWALPVLTWIVGQQGVLMRIASTWVGGSRLNHLPVPKRPRAVSFDDELPVKPLEGPSLPKCLAVGALLCSLFASYRYMQNPLGTPVDTFSGGRMGPGDYTGNKTIDLGIALPISFFSHGAASGDALPRSLLIRLLSLLVPVIVIWTIEASRRSNRFSLITLPTVFTISCQLFSLGKVSSVYFLFAVLSASNKVMDRHVPVAVARSILPATCLGYILPTLLMFLSFRNEVVCEQIIVSWQLSPVLTATLTALLTTFYQAPESVKGASTAKEDHGAAVAKGMEWYKKREVPILKDTYAFIFLVTALVHVSMILYALVDADMSLWSVLVPFASGWRTTDASDAGNILFKFDSLFTTFALLVFLLHTVWDIRKLGYITTAMAQAVATATLAGHVLVGPAATYAGVWYWREYVLADLSD